MGVHGSMEAAYKCVQVSEAIREGAEGFFATQYGVISRLSLVVAAGIFAIYLFRAQTPEQEDAKLSRWCSHAVVANHSCVVVTQ